MSYVVHILECSHGSYYTGTAANLNQRLWQQEQGMVASSHIYWRRPVQLVWASEECQNFSQALRWERQIKGWSRAKKDALIRGDYDAVHEIVKSERKRKEEIKRKTPR